MHQKLLRNVVFVGIAVITLGIIISGCISDPSIPPIQPMMTSTRFINAVTTGSAIDVYIDGQKIVSGKPYKTATNYMDIGSGDRVLFVTVAGSMTDTLFNQKITLASLTQQTIVMFGQAVKNPGYKYTPAPMLQTMERYTYSDEAKALADSNRTAVKLINVCTGTSPVQLHLDAIDGPIIISGPLDNVGKATPDGIAFGEPSPYTAPPVPLSPGTYNFYIVTTGGLNVFSGTPDYINAKVDKGIRYTFVLLGTSANAEYLVLTDDNK